MVWKNCPSLHHHQQEWFPYIFRDNSQECSLNFPVKRIISIFINLNFFSFLTWSAEKGFAWTFPSFSKRWASVHFHGSASHNLTSSDKFSLLLTPHYPHHPSSNCQFRFIYTKLTADTISRSLNLWEGLGSASAVACVFKLLTRVQPCFFVLPVLGFDSRQYHERWLSEDERVGGSLGIILIEIFHLECLKTGNCNNDRHGTQLLLFSSSRVLGGLDISLFDTEPSYNRPK